jgi:hypothetical protein
MMLWVAVGVGAYTGLVGLALGLCRAARQDDPADRAILDHWFDARRGQGEQHYPTAA